MHRFTISIGIAALAALLQPGLVQAQTVRVQSTPGIDFTNYKRYNWRVHPVFEKRPELVEQYSVGIELVKNAVNRNLMGRSFQSTQGPADFYITFFLTGGKRQDVDVVYHGGSYGWGGWYGWGAAYYPLWTETVVTNYIEGALVLDIVDAKTNQLAWRAYCRDDIREWKNRDRNIAKAVEKALKRFPPKPAKP